MEPPVDDVRERDGVVLVPLCAARPADEDPFAEVLVVGPGAAKRLDLRVGVGHDHERLEARLQVDDLDVGAFEERALGRVGLERNGLGLAVHSDEGERVHVDVVGRRAAVAVDDGRLLSLERRRVVGPVRGRGLGDPGVYLDDADVRTVGIDREPLVDPVALAVGRAARDIVVRDDAVLVAERGARADDDSRGRLLLDPHSRVAVGLVLLHLGGPVAVFRVGRLGVAGCADDVLLGDEAGQPGRAEDHPVGDVLERDRDGRRARLQFLRLGEAHGLEPGHGGWLGRESRRVRGPRNGREDAAGEQGGVSHGAPHTASPR